MALSELQRSISNWGRETFGPVPPRAIATRMNVEVAELLVCLDSLSELPPNGPDHEDARRAAGMECADVLIMLVQVAEGLGIPLETYVAQKMSVNRRRKWAKNPSGMMQHVEEDEPK